ncbi:unnamed protein product (macronuclear) [Paramecium tetraurelia]|uniref:Myb-like domain-containing protein n=1 Tax=Paramecium tetraurelia TaxID=5888 RepID=A0CFE2_PARTE|nr:uncharacterized protein GSPATT00037948001 [Paramecium tetraurelia]CAK69509.1 unnamed protein product [Paramecium tetraurelia]|eukprot:XP_001436906.1 hypothetical protein (macronuclear) [Paramecium tetraurelia strain d4-2]
MLNLKTKQHPLSTQKRQYWTTKEDKLLQKALNLHNSKWKTIAEYYFQRNGSQFSQRRKRIKPQVLNMDSQFNFERKFWTPEGVKFRESLIQKYMFEWKQSQVTWMVEHRNKFKNVITIIQTLQLIRNHGVKRKIYNYGHYINNLDQNSQIFLKLYKVDRRIQKRIDIIGTLEILCEEENPYYVIPQLKRSIEKVD